MNAEELWSAFVAAHPEAADAAYEAWCYGSEAADELARLTAEGIKTATASAYPLYELEGEELPKEGEYNVILLTDGAALCITKTTKVSIVPYREISADHAFREGEGDRSLSYWRQVHEPFFAEELATAGLTFTEDMGVVCEEFETVFKSAAAEAAFPQGLK